jgi:hypothetical protein
MLRIRPEQADSLDRVREQSFFGRLRGYLRDVANDYVEDMSDAELNREIEKAVFIGDRIGLESEYAHGLWAFLHVITDGETTRSYEIRQHFYKAMQDPEVVLKQILDDVLEQLGKG